MRTRGSLGKGGLETPGQTPDRSLAQAHGTRVRDFDQGHIRALSAQFAIVEILANFGGKFRKSMMRVDAAVGAPAMLQCLTTADGRRQLQAAYLERN
jgi:hypothetical protein